MHCENLAVRYHMFLRVKKESGIGVDTCVCSTYFQISVEQGVQCGHERGFMAAVRHTILKGD